MQITVKNSFNRVLNFFELVCIVLAIIHLIDFYHAEASRLISDSPANSGGADDFPRFLEPMNNVTVRVGQAARFQCVIDNLKNRKISWFRIDRHILLGTGSKGRITKDSRISIGNHSSKVFYMQIDNVKESDQGEYMCDISTLQTMRQSAFLQVNVAPSFIDELTSSDTDVNEGDSVSLRCAARGNPQPKIEWRREDRVDIVAASEEPSSSSFDEPHEPSKRIYGEFLNMTNIKWPQMGAYLCIANNSIPHSISKRIFLGVNFAPLIWTSNARVGAPLDGVAQLTCTVDAYPNPTILWLRASDNQIIEESPKYSLSSSKIGIFKHEVRLTIKKIQSSDFGGYICVAKYILNEASAKIALYEVPRPPIRAGPKKNSNRGEKIESHSQQESKSRHEIKKENEREKLNIASSLLTDLFQDNSPAQNTAQSSDTQVNSNNNMDDVNNEDTNSGAYRSSSFSPDPLILFSCGVVICVSRLIEFHNQRITVYFFTN
ncbi:neurotrimin-like [Brevipalpus obovatus]|uniref:neurotrimin-like n=1 Tax=Brevipalpus obovatus TaxID=246614 RepID=UPI003D9E81CD